MGRGRNNSATEFLWYGSDTELSRYGTKTVLSHRHLFSCLKFQAIRTNAVRHKKNKTVIDRRGTIVCPKRLCIVKSATKCNFRLISHAQILRQINRLLDVVCDLISRDRRCALH